ncbi:hypothetical protein AKJ16_DCAP02856 [Drosera capensis]
MDQLDIFVAISFAFICDFGAAADIPYWNDKLYASYCLSCLFKLFQLIVLKYNKQQKQVSQYIPVTLVKEFTGTVRLNLRPTHQHDASDRAVLNEKVVRRKGLLRG